MSSGHHINSQYPFDVPLAALQDRTSMKWRHYPSDTLPLWVAEMDVAPCPAVVEAVHRAVSSGDTGYHHGSRLAEAVAEFAATRWGWTITPKDTRIFPDVMSAIGELIQVFTDPGDAVVINPPVYPPFFAVPARHGRRVIEAPCTAAGRLDLVALEAAFAEATQTPLGGQSKAGSRPAVYLLCHPHNPTGTVHTRAELEAVVALAGRYRVTVIADEIHAPLTSRTASHIPLVSLPQAEHCVSVTSASKAWNLAGLRAALAVPGAAIAPVVLAMDDAITDTVSHLSVIAHEAALTRGVDWLDQVIDQLDHRRAQLGHLLAEHLPLVGYRIPQATYLAWLDCRRLPDVVSEHPARWFQDHARVAVNPGVSFGTVSTGFVRFNFGTSLQVITEAVQQMARSLP